jgi:hypothetical protein
MEMIRKYAKLDGLIVERYGTRGKFADDLGVTLTTLGRKINGKSAWKPKEIERSCDLLKIDKLDIPAYFF